MDQLGQARHLRLRHQPRRSELAQQSARPFLPGLHHLAFDADSREQVDGLYTVLKAVGARVLDPPAEYDYCPGYYAVFFADPDGIKLELCHTPGNY